MRAGTISNSFAKAGIQRFIVRSVVLIVSMVSGIITARWLKPANMGTYALVVLVPLIAFHFGNLGFGSAASFFAAQKKASNRKLFAICLKTGFIMSVIAGIVFWVIRTMPFSPWKDLDFRFFLLYTPAILVQFWTLYFQRILSGNLRITEVDIASGVTVISMLIFKCLFLVVFGWGLWGALLAAWLTYLMTCSYYFWRVILLVRKSVDTVDERNERGLLKNMWLYGRWNYLIMLSTYLYTELPLFFLKNLFSDFIVGCYSVTRSLEQRAQGLILPFASILLPFTAASKEQDAIYRTNMLCRISLLAMFSFVIGLFIVAKWLILFMYGQEYLPAVKVFYALLPGVFIWPLGHLLGIHIAASGKPYVTFFVSSAVLILAGITCYLVIPRYGGVGACLSVSLVYFINSISMLIVYSRITKSPFSEVVVIKKKDLNYISKTLSALLFRRK